MPKYQGGARGVQVKDDNGRMLGVAHHGGESLTSDDALRQLGYELDPEAGDGSGVRFLGSTGGGVNAGTTFEADRAAADAATADAAAARATADELRIAELEALVASHAETIQATRAANVAVEADLAAARAANNPAPSSEVGNGPQA